MTKKTVFSKWIGALTAACIGLISPATVFGWSQEAHRAIALIAAKRLESTSTAARISGLLGTLALADIATCPDEVRDLDEYKIPMSATCSKIFPKPPKGTANWHFVNTPIKDASFIPTGSDVNAACAKVCSVIQIQSFLAILAAAKPSDSPAKKLAEKQALAYVVHFIGDIHQPLHAANRNDSGGNAEFVKFFDTDALKLHGIWDNQIVARIDATQIELAGDLSAEISQAAAESQGTPIDWALQSYAYARDVAYHGIPPVSSDPAKKNEDVAELGQPYQDTAAPVVRIQVARAGVRLASALQTALP